ncbi:uncharacterized protein LOC135347946 [Halichondria panicea]|uniref:uncharacterized protein LOC135347946 n=1 Tax=Halichondria panicea TaxID=6063 RepID=UPI00312BAE7E
MLYDCHTTVPCLTGSTKKIVGISTVSRTDHGVAQTRELQCTKIAVPQAIARSLNVVEVAHDMQHQVSRYVTSDLGLKNSFDIWHGTKNLSKCLQKVTQGRVRDKGLTWFPELVDKQKSIKVHLYWAMKNCDGDGQKLRSLIENIAMHYQDNHLECHPSSTCHLPHYAPGKDLLTDLATVQQLEKQLKDTYIYRFPESFCRCRDMYWVESFNHQLLCYISKRVFSMRMNLAVLDWNENVGREHTSKRKLKDLRRPDRRTAMKALVKKTYQFAYVLWTTYVTKNMTSLDFLDEDDGDDGDDSDILEDGEIVPDSDSDYEGDDPGCVGPNV